MKKALSIILVLVMLLGVMPMAMAEGAGSGVLQLRAAEDLDTLSPHSYKFTDTRIFLQMIGGITADIHTAGTASIFPLFFCRQIEPKL